MDQLGLEPRTSRLWAANIDFHDILWSVTILIFNDLYFLWFSQNLIKTSLTEIKCLRIVYADMIFAYLSTFIKPTDYLFLLIYSWNNSQIFVLFALFTHCLRDVYALFTQNSRINNCISMYFNGCLHLHLLFRRHFCWKKAFLR